MNVDKSSVILSCTFTTAIIICLVYKYRWRFMARHKDTTRLKVICSKLGIEKLFVIQGDEEEVSAFKQKAVDLKAGDCSWLQRTELIKSTWRVSRVPYLLEWEHRSVTDDQGPYTHFANIDDFDPGDPVGVPKSLGSITNEFVGRSS